MTDLREKIEGILYDYGLEYGGPICMVTKATDAIMALVQPVCGDLHQTLKSALMDYADALLNGDDPDPDAAAEALARRVQPVVTDEPRIVIRGLRATPTEEQRQAFWDDPAGKGLYQIGDTVLAWVNEGDLYHPAVLPHAVTREQVLEELAVEAEAEGIMCEAYAPELDVMNHGPAGGAGWSQSLSQWLRSRKGGAS